MNVIYSRSFEKAVDKLSGKTLDSVLKVLIEVKQAKKIEDIKECVKLSGFNNVYRIRAGDYRMFFTLHIYVEGNTLFFEYLVPRGQAYISVLRKKDS